MSLEKVFFFVHWCIVHTNIFPPLSKMLLDFHNTFLGTIICCCLNDPRTYLIKPKPCDFWSYTNVDSFERKATMTTVFFLWAMLFSACFAKTSMHDLYEERKRKAPNAFNIQVPTVIIEWRPVAASFVTSSILVFLKLFSLSSKYFVLSQFLLFPSIFFFDLKIYFFKAEGLYWRNFRNFYKSKEVFNGLAQNK